MQLRSWTVQLVHFAQHHVLSAANVNGRADQPCHFRNLWSMCKPALLYLLLRAAPLQSQSLPLHIHILAAQTIAEDEKWFCCWMGKRRTLRFKMLTCHHYYPPDYAEALPAALPLQA